MRDARHLLLIPWGSGSEKIHGISHLFEHLLLDHLYETVKTQGLDFSGHTTEDYILISGKEMKSGELLNAVLRFNPGKNQFLLEKKKLQYEIDVKKKGDSETFFRTIWKDSAYERSPLGSNGEIEELTFPSFKEFVRQVQEGSFFMYSHPGRVTVRKKMDAEPDKKPQKSWKRDNDYSILYFNLDIELHYLVSSILQLFNPDKHIQVSEKKECSALIMEKGVAFPPLRKLPKLREQALSRKRKEWNEMEDKPLAKGIRELESLYFYQTTWRERQDRFFSLSETDLREACREIEAAKDGNH